MKIKGIVARLKSWHAWGLKRWYVVTAVRTCPVLLISFYLGCINYIEPNEVAITWNTISGEMRLETQAGFYLSSPFVRAAKIDKRPMRVCITSSGRSFNCRLVQFVPGAYKEFLAVQGFHYYWLSNRLSFNAGYDEEYRGMKDLMRGYSYGLQKYPFVTVLQEYPD